MTIHTYWPNGELKKAPYDGHTEDHAGERYMWDGYLESWVDSKGELKGFAPENDTNNVYYLDGDYGYSLHTLPQMYEEFENSVERIGNGLNAFKVKTCECGAEKVKSSFHSGWCPKHEKQ
jgi:hypothetical protein